ncbi:MAG: NAD(P)H-dependent oxidoreductase [Hamadaea sp.]|nr:NAD(P)H-dependent oxidoreductase [Hamadaea sp.]
MSGPDPVLRVLVLGASLRPGSYNVTLAALAADLLRESGVAVDLAEFRDFQVPGYDADAEGEQGVPAGAARFAERLADADAFVIASPEYNASMPGTLKNLIDWTSRLKPHPFWGHHGLLLSASPRLTGGNRGLWALRVPLEHLGARMFPEMVSVAQADEAFTHDGLLRDDKQARKLRKTIESFVDFARRATR